ncbi:hypothetical protein [Candidatus Nephthysia bennettiae]
MRVHGWLGTARGWRQVASSSEELSVTGEAMTPMTELTGERV